MTRWSLSVTNDLDMSLRSFLGSRGMKKGDLSKYVERAVRSQMFDEALAETYEQNRNVPLAEIEEAIEEALAHVRANPE
jgi:hypothetical protein